MPEGPEESLRRQVPYHHEALLSAVPIADPANNPEDWL
jgi:hypothetical protein